MFFVADRVAGCSEFQTYSSGDITGINLFQVGTLVGMHLKDAAKAFLFVLCGIQDVRAGVGHT